MVKQRVVNARHQLLEAARSGDAATVQRLADSGAKLTGANEVSACIHVALTESHILTAQGGAASPVRP